MNTKIKKGFVLIILFALLVFLTAFTVNPVYAEQASETPVEITEQENGEGLSEFADKFCEYLKKLYGEDYDYYYGKIIKHWGSVEAYLISLGETLPEKYQSGWDKFVSWLSEYSVIWAPVLSLFILVLIAVIGKKQFNKLLERAVNIKVKPIVAELNLQSNATLSIIRAQKALLGSGSNEKFADEIKELDEAEKELTNG